MCIRDRENTAEKAGDITPAPKFQIGGMSPAAQAKTAQGIGVAQGFVDMIMALKGPGKQPTRGTSPGEGALSGVADEDGYVAMRY